MSAGSRRSVAFQVLGRPFSARGVDDDLAAWLARHWDHPHHRLHDHTFSIDLHCSPRPALPSASLDLLPERSASDVDAATPRHSSDDGERASVLLGSREGGAQLELRCDGARVQAWGVHAPGAAGRWPLLLALHEAVRASGLLPLHCAAAVHPDEDGASALLGASGVGKSTTLLTLAHAGWAPVCEDFAWLDPNTMQLYAWDHGVHMLPDTLERLGTQAPPTQRAPAGGKHLLTYRDLAEHYGVARRVAAPLQRLAWLVRDEGPSRWTDLPRVQAVPVLWEAIGLPLTGPARRQVSAHIAALVDAVELRTLRLGRTPVPTTPPG